MDAHSLEKLEFEQVRHLLAGYARCSLGRQIALRVAPVRHRDQIGRWLCQVKEMLALIEVRGAPPFGGVHDIRQLISKAEPPSPLKPEDFAAIAETLAATDAINKYFTDLPERFEHTARLAERIGNLLPLAEQIWRVIDRRGQVRDDATERLASIRRKIADAQQSIGQVVDRLLRSPHVLRLLQYPNSTFHNDRIVLPLRAEHRGRLEGIIHRTSDSGATLFVEPAEAVELNNTIISLRQDEHEEIGRILWDLSQTIHLNRDQILKTIDALAALDLVTAKALMARAFDMTVPQIGEDGVLRLREARHPLLLAMQLADVQAERPAPEVVPIDVRLGDDFDMLVITGPNTGGKTAALKTVGLLAAMAQSGMPIPAAEGSALPVYDDVLIDVGDEQSLQQSLSTFSSHMSQILRMLRRARETTLVLLDELGAGTDPDEGAALGQAVLDELLRRGSPTMVTTHLGTLKSLAFRRRRVDNAAVEFDEATLQPKYRLLIGEPGNSNAIAIAARLGLPRRLTVSAQRNISGKYRALTRAIAGTLVTKRLAEEARSEAEAVKREAVQAKEAAQQQAELLEKKRGEFERWAQQVVQLRRGDSVYVRSFDRHGTVVRMALQRQRAEIDFGSMSVDVSLAELQPERCPPPPKRPEPTRPQPQPHEQHRDKKDVRAADRSKKPEAPAGPDRKPPPRQVPTALSAEQLSGLEVGQEVFVRRFRRRGTLVRLKRDKQLASVSVGAMEIEVPFGELSEVRHPPAGRRRPAGDANPSGRVEKDKPAASGSKLEPTKQPGSDDESPSGHAAGLGSA